tara:strand:+ start:1091 stop:1297 length:207 start_codon:yes stop_codon:yes gene_type:complete
MASYKETIVKTLIWRVVATTITFLVSWWISGNFEFGLMIGGIDTILKTIGYFTYERLWLRIKGNSSEI